MGDENHLFSLIRIKEGTLPRSLETSGEYRKGFHKNKVRFIRSKRIDKSLIIFRVYNEPLDFNDYNYHFCSSRIFLSSESCFCPRVLSLRVKFPSFPFTLRNRGRDFCRVLYTRECS